MAVERVARFFLNCFSDRRFCHGLYIFDIFYKSVFAKPDFICNCENYKSISGYIMKIVDIL